MAKFGKNILDNLTTGMYSDSKVIYREYIQNACDQIDIANEMGFLHGKGGEIEIYIDKRERFISIEDNATGVKATDFVANLGDIANSNKVLGESKGFRGIGRLCGLAYCKTLRFETSYYGEDVASIMICDAKKMREMLYENKKYSVDDVWDSIVRFSTKEAENESHYFKVEMENINSENTDLLDEGKIREYLSFVAPVQYKNTFILASKIYDYAKSINCRIDEYRITINGAQIFKEYNCNLKEKRGSSGLTTYDEVTDLEFHEYLSPDGERLAWSWVGISSFEKMIPKNNLMRGIRLRSSNIQLGGDETLKNLFKENRANYYFIGEVFATDKCLIPNSQRDYFNENRARVEFEAALIVYFYDTLHSLYTEGNKIKNAYKHQESYTNKIIEYHNKDKSKGFVDEDEKLKMQLDVDKAKDQAEKSKKVIEKYKKVDADSPLAIVSKNIQKKHNSNNVNLPIEEAIGEQKSDLKNKGKYAADDLSKLNRNERKLVRKIMVIITDNAPKEISEVLIRKIKEEFK